MAFSFDRLKHISIPTKHLINGYIRNCQAQLFGEIAANNPYYNIPQLINNHCILFYELFTWYKNDKQQGVKFISDTEAKSIADGWTTCLFENVISNDICDKFSITFKVISFRMNKDTPDFDIGYTLENTIEESMKEWYSPLGEGNNKQTSASWNICGSTLYSYTRRGLSTVKMNVKYSVGDTFRLLFDFKEKKVKIYYNDEENDCENLNVTKLWVGMSLYYKGSQIKMIEYKYD